MRDPAADKHVTLRGLRFHYREYGKAGARPLVLLHGVASNSRIWITTAPLLAQRFHVLALDQRGHGESDKPDSGYDFASVAGDAVAFIEALELQRPIVAGHSWGGNVAIELAATHPELPAGIALIDGGYIELQARDGMTRERAEREMAPPDLSSLTPEQLIRGAKQWELGPIWSDEVEAALMGNFDVTEAGTVRPRLSRANHMQVVRAFWDQRPSELSAQVRCPVLFVVCEREGSGRTREWIDMKRAAVSRLEGLLADCRVRWFADTIHDIPLHRPAELAQAIEEFAFGLDA
jgi:pimeloyl-ACP methyl ester carboxylesterase